MTRVSVGALLALGLLAAPLTAAAQPAGKVYRIGYLGGSHRAAPLVESFQQGLRDLGYVENRNMILTIRWGEANAERLHNFAAEYHESLRARPHWNACRWDDECDPDLLTPKRWRASDARDGATRRSRSGPAA
jgi:hypothetical protein